MSEILTVSASGITASKQDINLDNIYVDGRYVSDHTEPQSRISKTSTADVQVYAVTDAGALAKDRERAARDTDSIYRDLYRINEEMDADGFFDRQAIWQFLLNAGDTLQTSAYRANGEVQGMSFAGIFLQNGKGIAVHAGDSRIYVIRGDKVLKITDDHLEVTTLLQNGIINQDQMEIHKKNSRLSAYLGMEGLEAEEDIFFTKTFKFYAGDIFLICTDGVSDTFRQADLERLFRNSHDVDPSVILQVLSDRAYDKNDDDHALVVLRVETAGEAANTSEPVRPAAATVPKAPARVEEEPEEEEEPEASGFLGKVSGFFGKLFGVGDDDEEDEDEEYGYGQPAKTSARPSAAQPDENEDDEPGFFAKIGDKLHRTFHPEDYEDGEDEDDEDEEEGEERGMSVTSKLIAIVAGVVLVMILLLILIIRSCREGGEESKPEPEESRIESIAESEPESEPESTVASEPESEPVSTEESAAESTEESAASEPESTVESEPESTVESEPESVDESGDRTCIVISGDGWASVAGRMYPELGTDYATRSAVGKVLQTLNKDKALRTGVEIVGPSLEEMRAAIGR